MLTKILPFTSVALLLRVALAMQFLAISVGVRWDAGHAMRKKYDKEK